MLSAAVGWSAAVGVQDVGVGGEPVHLLVPPPPALRYRWRLVRVAPDVGVHAVEAAAITDGLGSRRLAE